MRKHWKKWMAVALAICISVQPMMTVSATEPGQVLTQEIVPGDTQPVEETEPSVEEQPGEETEPSVEEQPGEETEPSVEEQPGEETAPFVEEVQPGEETEPSEEQPGEEMEPSIEEEQPGEETEPSEEELSEEEMQPEEDAQLVEETSEILEDDFVIPPLTYQDVDDEVDSVTQDPDYVGPMYATLETKYDPLEEGVNLPNIRNQSPYGTCWAHSSVGLGEVAYYKNHPTEESMELSELHLAYFSYNPVKDPLGGLDGDSNAAVGDTFLDRGGNLVYSSVVLASWVGAAAEATAPYSQAADALTNGLDTSISFTDQMHLQGVLKLDMDTDQALVKQMIKEYGAVGISYYEDHSSHNSTYASYYQNTKTSTNHAVMIVGWDDDFSKENFTTTPEGNGAWLIRNSWGGTSTGYNYRSYFWISYYDTSLSDTAYVFKYEDADNYDHNYQYDGAMLSGRISCASTANVFTAKANEGGKEKLKAVAFDTPSVNVNYKVEIYTDLTDSTNPESGTLVSEATTSGVTTAAGYYTVPLNAEVLLEEGTKFSVVISLTKESETPYMSMEYSMTASWFDSVASAKAEQSFVKYGSGWTDYGNLYGRNIRIKAFTDSYTVSNPVTEITLSETEKEINKGETFTLSTTLTPADTDSILTWSSSDTSVATVDKTGKVTAVGAGSADITVSAEDVSATCAVTVKAPAESIQISESTVSMNVDDTYQLTATVSPDDTTDTLTWSSSDSSIASVDNTGMVTGKKVGTATITATAGSKSAKCVVTVSTKEVKVQSITLSKTTAELNKGGSVSLTANVTPTDTTSTLTWSSSNTAVATVTSNGVVTAVGVGSATITASADGVSATCKVTVKSPATLVSISDSQKAIYVGGTVTLTATVLPADTTDTLTWSSSDSNIAAVDSSGKVTGKKAGTATITATAGSKSAKCVVTVSTKEVKVQSITLSKTTAELNKGGSLSLTANVTPTDTTSTLTWSSSNTSVATVTSNGVVTAVGVGSATITASADGVSATCKVTVKQPETGSKFIDVSPNAYYATPVDWAVLNGITSGTSATTFEPESDCTRGQIVTFLWRAAGCPEPTSTNNPFGDVKSGAYYYKAVLWAVEKGITTGTSSTTFSPNETCTRAQSVTFLYRYAGKPSVGAVSNPFGDVKNGSYYYSPVLWAVSEGITNGTSQTAFSPDNYCTRGQIVTFLYRQAN